MPFALFHSDCHVLRLFVRKLFGGHLPLFSPLVGRMVVLQIWQICLRRSNTCLCKKKEVQLLESEPSILPTTSSMTVANKCWCASPVGVAFLESGDPELNSERAFVARSLRGRSEVPTQDDQDRVFDMTVADSPDEVDIDEVALNHGPSTTGQMPV